MTQDSFDNLLGELGRAGIDYATLHRVLAAFFSARCCGVDSDALADLTIDRLAHQFEHGAEIRNLIPYARGIAAHVYAGYCGDRKGLIEAARELAYLNGEAQEPEVNRDLRLSLLIWCLKKLPERERRLVLDYYSTGRDRQALADELGVPITKLYSIIHKIKCGLRKSVEDCQKRM